MAPATVMEEFDLIHRCAVEFDRVCGEGALVDRHTGDVWAISLITETRFEALPVRACISQVVALRSTRGADGEEQGIACF